MKNEFQKSLFALVTHTISETMGVTIIKFSRIITVVGISIFKIKANTISIAILANVLKHLLFTKLKICFPFHSP